MDAGRQRDPRGWGYLGDGPTAAEQDRLRGLLGARFPGADLTAVPPRAIPVFAPSRIAAPPGLTAIVRTDQETRLLHAVGRSTTDLLALRDADLPWPPDAVACPRTEEEVEAVLAWCADAGAACIPFGGGTSVVGGLEARDIEDPVVVLQTRAMAEVLDVDRTSRAVHVQAGIEGPALEAALAPEGLTFRFFPQSFALSTVGGWIATRAAGHDATGPTHIDDLVQAVSAVTPIGRWASRRLPASGAGPSPDRLLLGSEGALGVITSAWLRVRPRVQQRAARAVHFRDLPSAAAAVRGIVQAGLRPAGCRVLDPLEAALNVAGDGSAAVLLLAFESSGLPVEGALASALELARDAGGDPQPAEGHHRDPGAAWRSSFLRAPHLRDSLLGMGVLTETFETAITWDRLDALVQDVTAAVTAAVTEVCGDGIVTCRLTHAYPDGAAPYFTVIAPGRRGEERAQWAHVKAAASEALLAAGGTITHHHAVGRDHREWAALQRPAPFSAALAAAKATLDPNAICNPGALLGPTTGAVAR